MNELYTVNTQGQLEINFKVLETIASEVMVSEIMKDLQDEDTTVIAVKESDLYIQVVTANKYDKGITIYDCLKNSSNNDYDVMYISKNLIHEISDSLKGGK